MKSDTRRNHDGRLKTLRMRIQLYTEPGCGACEEARSFLTLRGISFEERNIRSSAEYERILAEELDSCTTPTLVAGDKIIVGFDRAEYSFLPAPQSSVRTRNIRSEA